jgi:hypothetical protein
MNKLNDAIPELISLQSSKTVKSSKGLNRNGGHGHGSRDHGSAEEKRIIETLL